MKKSNLLALSAILALNSVFADELQAPKVVVSASGFEQDADSNLRNVIVISGEDLRQKGYSSLEDALKRQAGLNFVDNGTGGQGVKAIDMRGQGNQANSAVRVMVDGVQANALDTISVHFTGTQYDPLQSINLNDIERIEIIPGGGAVLYGNGTRGGVINIITRKNKQNSAQFSLRESFFDSGRNGHDLRTNLSYGFGENLRVSANLNVFDKEGYREKSEEKGFNLALKAQANLSESTRLNANFSFYKDKDTFTGALPLEQTKANPTKAGSGLADFSIKVPSFNIELEQDFGEKIKASLQGFIKRQYFTQNLSNFYPKSSYEDGVNGINFKTKFDYAQNSYLTFGYSLENHKGKTDASVDYTGGRSPNASVSKVAYNLGKLNHGVYVYDSHSFGKFSLSGGARFERANYEIDNATSTAPILKASSNNYAFELTPAFAYSENGRVYAKFERGFISPAPLHFRGGSARTGYYINPFMKTAKYDTYELGMSDFWFDFNNINLAVFYTTTKDEISANVSGAHTVTFSGYHTFPKTKRYGVELNLRQDLFNDKVSFYENLSYVNAKIKDGKLKTGADYSGSEIPFVSKIKATAGASYEIIKDLRAFVDLSYTSSQKESLATATNANTLKTLDGYFLTDIGVRYSIKGLTLGAGIKNLFDEFYSRPLSWDYSGGYEAQDGRSYYFEIDYKF